MSHLRGLYKGNLDNVNEAEVYNRLKMAIIRKRLYRLRKIVVAPLLKKQTALNLVLKLLAISHPCVMELQKYLHCPFLSTTVYRSK